MSSVNKNSVNQKLKKLEESIKMLEEYKKVQQNDFFEDATISGATIHYLVLGIEIIIDVGNHILTEAFQEHADSYEEIILKLGEVKVVPEDFAKDNADMAKFRNLLIHEYIKVNMKIVYKNLQEAPDIFRKFAKYYLEFLEKI